MILPCITYNCTVNLNLTQTQRQKLQTIDRLAEKIIGKKQTSIENEIKKHSVTLVCKCAQKETYENFKDYFKIQSHDQVTRKTAICCKYQKKWILLHGRTHELQRITN